MVAESAAFKGPWTPNVFRVLSLQRAEVPEEVVSSL